MPKITATVKDKLRVLKKAGLSKVDLRKKNVSRYQISLTKKYADVISGESKTVKLTKTQKSAFKKAGNYEIKGDRLVVRDLTPYSSLSNKGGKIKITETLKNGAMTKIMLPYSAKNIHQLIEKIERDENLPDELNAPNGDLAQYAFSIGGHGSLEAFTSKAALVDYFKTNYNHILKSGVGIDNFSLIYFNSGNSELPDVPASIGGKKLYSPAGQGRKFTKSNASGRNYQPPKKNRKQKAQSVEASRRYRENLTPDQREANKKKARDRAKLKRKK